MIRYCKKCKRYSLNEKCPICKGKTVINKPARFLENKDYSKERLKLKGLI